MQTDGVLKGAMTSMVEVERKVAVLATQGDAAAAEIEELEHRIGIIQRALVETASAKDSTDPVGLNYSLSMRRGRRAPHESPVRGDSAPRRSRSSDENIL